MFKKEYLFIFVILGLGLAYGIISFVIFLTRGKWKRPIRKKLSLGAIILGLTTLINTGSVTFANENQPTESKDPAVKEVKPGDIILLYGVPIETPKPTAIGPVVKYGVPKPTATPPLMKYGLPKPTATPTVTSPPIVVKYAVPTPTGPMVKYGIPWEYGDVDRNGRTDIIDALKIAQYSVGIKVKDFYKPAADVNLDGKIGIVDALLVAQKYVGIIKTLPYVKE